MRGAISAAGNRCPDKTQTCSPAPTISRSSGAAPRPAPKNGLSAEFAASVPPETKVTQRELTPAKRATSLLASSTIRRAARPSACTEDGLPVVSIAASAASRASGRNGAVAL